MRISDILRHVEELAPLSYAASWDNCGLQFGNPDSDCSGVVLALNATEDAIASAERNGANLLLTHHPLIFKAVKRLDTRVAPGCLIERMARAGITCYAAHTNLDTTACNDHLARLLGLPLDRVLQIEGHHALFKLNVAVPASDTQAVLLALWEAGAGKLGHYDQASFRTRGVASFRPLEGARPTVGTIGSRHQGDEDLIEVMVPAKVRGAVLKALKLVHPYEEPAYELVRLENGAEPYGIGVWGELPLPQTIEQIAERVRREISPRSLRLVGDRARAVYRVAICSGSGGDLVRAAAAQGVQLLITGEVRYHTALEAQELGVAVLEAGHQATEEPVLDFLKTYLSARVSPSLPIHLVTEPEPFEVLS